MWFPNVMKHGFWQRGGAWVLAQWILMAAIVVVAPFWPDGWPGLLSRLAAGVFLVAGAVFGIGGVMALGANRTIFPEPGPKAKLVRTGLYAHVRHPLYASVILLSFAWALWWRSLPGLVAAGLTVVFLDAKARSEEERLRARFLDYQNYAKRVKRLVPWVY
jgi:protein-S-isoprenylcysteine O-methyltransferase Ste14